MARPGRTDLNRLRLLDPARHVGPDPARTQRALDSLHRRITSEAHDVAPTPGTTTAPAPVRPAATGRVRHLRVGVVAALALVVVLGAVVAVLTVRPGTRSQPSVVVPADLTPYASVIGLEPGSGFRVAGVDTAAGTQTAEVVGTDDPTVFARVTVGGAVSPAPTPVAGRSPVDLGHGVVAHWISGDAPGIGGPPQADILTWDTDGFASDVQTSEFGNDSDVIAIAKAVRIVAPVPVRIPVSVPSLPAGWQLRGLATTGVDAASAPSRFVTVSIAVPGGTRSDGSSPSLDISTRAPGLEGDDETGAAVVIDGRTWRWNTNADTLTWHGPDRVVSVGPPGSSGTPAVPAATLTAFVARLSFASSFQDTSTWFDAATALPS